MGLKMGTYHCRPEKSCGYEKGCSGYQEHDGEFCFCKECSQSRHVLIIKDPPKLSFPCHHGHDCACKKGN